jgi:hypothetical protein
MIGRMWAPDQIRQLLEMREDGATAEKIGRALGFSRSAVLGKCNRLGLNSYGSPSWSAFGSRKTTRPPRPAEAPKRVKRVPVFTRKDAPRSVATANGGTVKYKEQYRGREINVLGYGALIKARREIDRAWAARIMKAPDARGRAAVLEDERRLTGRGRQSCHNRSRSFQR